MDTTHVGAECRIDGTEDRRGREDVEWSDTGVA